MEVGRWRRVPGGVRRQYRFGLASVSGASRALCVGDDRRSARCQPDRPLTRTPTFVGRAPRAARRRRAVRRTRRRASCSSTARAGSARASCCARSRRRGARAGWTPFALDARDLPPVPDAVEQALAGAWSAERPLVLIDTYERMSALGGYLRSTLLPSLPASAVVVVAGRDEPEPGWFEGGWETVARRAAAAPAVARSESRALLARHGLDERLAARRRSRAGPAGCRWRCGSARPPRARIAAWSPGADAGAAARAPAAGRRRGARRASSRDVFALACVARVVTPALIGRRAAGRRRAGGAALAGELRVRGLAAGRCDAARARPPAAARRAARARAGRERELRARVADSLHARALRRSGADDRPRRPRRGSRGARRLQLGRRRRPPRDRPEPGDDASLPTPRPAPFFDGRAGPRARRARRRRRARAATRSRSRPTPTRRSRSATRGSGAGSRTRAGEKRSSGATRSTSSRDPRSRVQALLNMATILRSGLRNPRYAYLPIDPRSRAALAFSAAVGARHVPELDATAGSATCSTTGRAGCSARSATSCTASSGCAAALDPEAVRDALRNLHRPGADAPRAPGSRTPPTRAFGDTPDEQLLRRVLIRGYFDPAPSHEAAARELHLSRAAYFRRLRAASERVAEWLGYPRWPPDRQLGAGAWSYFGDPRAISSRRTHVHGLDLDDRPRRGSPAIRGRQALQEADLPRPGA